MSTEDEFKIPNVGDAIKACTAAGFTRAQTLAISGVATSAIHALNGTKDMLLVIEQVTSTYLEAILASGAFTEGQILRVGEIIKAKQAASIAQMEKEMASE